MVRSALAAIDVGTTSVRAALFDLRGRPLAHAAIRQRTRTPRRGWVEQDPEELYGLVVRTLRAVRTSRGGRGRTVEALGVTNQRESIVALRPSRGRAIGPAVIWEDVRTRELSQELSREGWGERAWDLGGLPLGTYASAPKMRWLLEHDPRVREAASSHDLRFGTLDAWILYRLQGGKARRAPWLTDATNASRTLLYDLERGGWSDELLAHFGVSPEMLPEVRPSFGEQLGTVLGVPGWREPTPVTACLGDQQAGLLGVAGVRPRSAKITFGTGAFFLAEGAPSGSGRAQGLIRTVLWRDPRGHQALGLEGGVGSAGSLLDWMTLAGLGGFSDVAALERAARSVPDSGGVLLVPSLGGLFAPHWDPQAQGAVFGLTRGTSPAHLARAAMEGVAHRVADILLAYRQAVGVLPGTIWVDGGLSRSGTLMQWVADASGADLRRAPVPEATARGAAMAAGIEGGWFTRPEALPTANEEGPPTWRPRVSPRERDERRQAWAGALSRTRSLR